MAEQRLRELGGRVAHSVSTPDAGLSFSGFLPWKVEQERGLHGLVTGEGASPSQPETELPESLAERELSPCQGSANSQSPTYSMAYPLGPELRMLNSSHLDSGGQILSGCK